MDDYFLKNSLFIRSEPPNHQNLESHCVPRRGMRYSIRVAKHGSRLRGKVREPEYRRFAEEFVDLLVDPKRTWFVRYTVMGGLDHIPTEEEINSGDFALRVLNLLERGEAEMIEVSLYEALNTGDREVLVPYTRKWAQDYAFSREDLRMLLKIGKSSSLRHSFKRLNSKFDFRSGGQTKISRAQYDKLLKRAEQLRPAIEKILIELSSNTSHTLEEILDYCRKDEPGACNFLSLHLQRLKQAFKDKRVVNRATKRTSARARALADAMAGTDFELAFSTSIEKVREARRIARRQGPPPNSPQIPD